MADEFQPVSVESQSRIPASFENDCGGMSYAKRYSQDKAFNDMRQADG